MIKIILKNIIENKINSLKIKNQNKKTKNFIEKFNEIKKLKHKANEIEFNFFSLNNNDSRSRLYKNNWVQIAVKPGIGGLITIFDKDIWIYSVYKIQKHIHLENIFQRNIKFTPYKLFKKIKKSNNKENYNFLKKSLLRLQGTVIRIEIRYNKYEKEMLEYNLIDSWKILEHKKKNLKFKEIEIIIPNWLYKTLQKYKKIYKFNKNYFKIKNAINRRIYEIIYRNCKNKNYFSISLEELYCKTECKIKMKIFKNKMKHLSKINNFPDYYISYNNINTIIFSKR